MQMKYIDSHCHLSSDTHICGVGAIYNAVQPSDWRAIASAIDDNSDIFGAVGIHPWHISSVYNGWDADLTDLLMGYPELMLGEIGLDKHRPDMDAQIAALNIQLNIAHKLNRGVCLHCVGAWDKLLFLLKQNQNGLPRFILSHGYTGPVADTEKLSDRYNMYFSYGPRDLINPVRLIATPLDRILAETDSNNPENVISVVKGISDILGIAPGKMADIIYANTTRMLRS